MLWAPEQANSIFWAADGPMYWPALLAACDHQSVPRYGVMTRGTLERAGAGGTAPSISSAFDIARDPGRSFDLVILFGLPDPGFPDASARPGDDCLGVLTECHRRLNPGGRLLIGKESLWDVVMQPASTAEKLKRLRRRGVMQKAILKFLGDVQPAALEGYDILPSLWRPVVISSGNPDTELNGHALDHVGREFRGAAFRRLALSKNRNPLRRVLSARLWVLDKR
jgi:hypothetical protein